MQMILITLIGVQFKTTIFVTVKIQVAITRFVCAYLLHFAMEPEFRQSLTLLKYYLNHSNNLDLTEPKLTKPKEPEYEDEEVVTERDN